MLKVSGRKLNDACHKSKSHIIQSVLGINKKSLMV